MIDFNSFSRFAHSRHHSRPPVFAQKVDRRVFEESFLVRSFIANSFDDFLMLLRKFT